MYHAKVYSYKLDEMNWNLTNWLIDHFLFLSKKEPPQFSSKASFLTFHLLWRLLVTSALDNLGIMQEVISGWAPSSITDSCCWDCSLNKATIGKEARSRHLQTHFWHCNMLLRYCDILAMSLFPKNFERFPELCHLCQNYVWVPRIQAILILMSSHLLIMASLN
jgi:hypothetical protein